MISVGHALLGAEHAVRADPGARVGLHADEVVAGGGVEEDVLHAAADLVELRLAAVDGLVVAHGQRDAHRHPGRVGPDGVDRGAVGPHEHLVHVAAGVAVALAGREGAAQVADGGHHARLVDRARPLHQPVEARGRLLAVGGEALGHVVALPAARGRRATAGW